MGKGFVDCDSYLISGGGLGFNRPDSRFRGNDGARGGNGRGEKSGNGGARKAGMDGARKAGNGGARKWGMTNRGGIGYT